MANLGGRRKVQCIRTGGYLLRAQLWRKSATNESCVESEASRDSDLLYTSTLCSCISCRRCARRWVVSTVPISILCRGREREKSRKGCSGLGNRKEVQERRMGWEKSMDTKGGPRGGWWGSHGSHYAQWPTRGAEIGRIQLRAICLITSCGRCSVV